MAGEPLATETLGCVRMFLRFLGLGVLAFEAGERHVHTFGAEDNCLPNCRTE